MSRCRSQRRSRLWSGRPPSASAGLADLVWEPGATQRDDREGRHVVEQLRNLASGTEGSREATEQHHHSGTEDGDLRERCCLDRRHTQYLEATRGPAIKVSQTPVTRTHARC
ncbi:MAG: hypothetical protein U5K37_01740 [Natrialbaceae archaeon]|nr:hypothetical protein [Natrialbaceae archaeon]